MCTSDGLGDQGQTLVALALILEPATTQHGDLVRASSPFPHEHGTERQILGGIGLWHPSLIRLIRGSAYRCYLHGGSDQGIGLPRPFHATALGHKGQIPYQDGPMGRWGDGAMAGFWGNTGPTGREVRQD